MPKYNVDFTNASDGFTLPPEGDYICKVKSVEMKEGPKGKYLNWTLVIGTGPSKGTSVFHMTSFSPNALFGLRNFLIACGQDVPKKAFTVNTDLCINKVVGGTLVHQEYEDKTTKEKKKSGKFSEVYQVIKTDKGYVKFSPAAEVLKTPAPAEEEDIPFDLTTSLEEDDDEIDI